MEALFYFLLGLLFITLAGIGLWVVVAAILRAVGLASPRHREASHRPRKECLLCHHVLHPDDDRCPGCGELRKNAGRLADLRTTLAQLREFQTNGLLSEADFDRLSAHIEQKRQQVRTRRAPIELEEQVSPEPADAPSAAPRVPVPTQEEEILVALAVPESETVLPVQPVGQRVGHHKPGPKPLKPQKPPKPPRRTLAEWMAAFMEERNILWGELIGGLLMVGCSIALVFSLWRTLEVHLPLFPFLILAGLTSAIFGAGQYTLHHWKLTSTSRGLLVIATLLVPLNFLMLAAISEGPAGGLVEVITKIVATTFFFWMVNHIVLTLLPNLDNPSFTSLFRNPLSFVSRSSLFLADSLLLPLAMVLGSASQLPVKRLLEPAEPNGWFTFLGSWAVGLFGVGVGGALAKRMRDSDQDERQSGSLLVFLGLASFALIMSLGFLGFWIGSKGAPGALPIALEQTAYLVMQAGAAVLAVGLFVRDRTKSAQAGSSASHLLMTGTIVALAGMLVMLAGVILAWPNPTTLIIVCLFNFVALTLATFYFRLPVGHAVALVCLAVGYLTAYHVAAGDLAGVAREQWANELVRLAWSQQSGIALAVLFAIIVAASEALAFWSRLGDALYFQAAAWVVALCGLAIVAIEPVQTIFGPDIRPELYRLPTIVYLLHVVAALTLSWRWHWKWLEHVGASLILVTTIWGMKWNHSGEYSLWAAVFATEALVFSLVEAGWLVETILAAALALATTVLGRRAGLREGLISWHSINAMLLAATAFTHAWRWRARWLSWLGSGLVLVGIGHALIERVPDWFPNTEFSTPLLIVATLLGHATLVQLASLAVRTWRKDEVSLFAVPLGQSALITMSLAVPVLFVDVQPSQLLIRAGFCLWLAVLWLANAIIERRPQLFAVFQVTVSLAVLFITQEWMIDRYPQGLLDPRSLQTFGLGLTGLSLLWGATRILLRSNSPAQNLFNAVRPGFDRVQLYALVAGQAALIVGGILPGILTEMTPAGVALDQFQTWSETSATLFGVRAWLLLVGLAGVLVFWFWESRTALNQTGLLVALMILALLAAALYAGPFAPEQATASGLRWGLAVCFVLITALLLYRRQLGHLGTTLRLHSPLSETADLLRGILVLGAALPAVALTVWMALDVFAGQPPRGADAASFYSRIGSTVSHITPLVLVMIGLTGHALRERSAGFAFAGGLVANLITMGGYALGVIQSGHSLGSAEYVAILQLGTIASSVWALGWLAVLHVASPRSIVLAAPLSNDIHKSLLSVQSFMGAAGMALLTLLPLRKILFEPFEQASPFLLQAGHTLGWLALITSALAALWFLRRVGSGQQGHFWGPVALALGVLFSCSWAQWDTGNWVTYHVLVMAWIIGAWGLLFAGQSLGQSSSPLRVRTMPWVEVLGGLAVFAALVGEAKDPWRPWGPSASLLAVSLLAGNLAILKRRQAEVFVSALLLIGSALMVWRAKGAEGLSSFTAAVVLGLSLASIAWTLLERFHHLMGLAKAEGNTDALAFARPFRQGSAVASVAVLALIACDQLLFPETFFASFALSSLSWYAIVATALAVLLCFWDEKAVFVLPTSYAIALTTVLMGVLAFDLHGKELQRIVMLSVAGFGLIAASLSLIAPQLTNWRQALRLPRPTPLTPAYWFAGAETAVACIPLLLSLPVVFSHETLVQRLAAPLSIGLVGVTSALLAQRAVDSWKNQLSYATLILGVFLTTATGWALIEPAADAQVLHRLVSLLIALGVTTVVYGFVLPRVLLKESLWRALSRQIAPVLGLTACVTLFPILLLEGKTYRDLHTPLNEWEVGAVLLAIVGLIVAGIAFAVVPWADPFGLSEKRRRYYVYASELLLFCLFLHLRFNVPEIFPRLGGRYWTFFVMAVAFVGVGLSEFFSRRKLDVLSEPLRRTGMFLPLLPLLAFWLQQPSEAIRNQLIGVLPGSEPLLDTLSRMPHNFDSYAILWFLFGLLYAFLAVTQRSFRHGLFAALAANVGLWMLWNDFGIAFRTHPQMWLIPLALIILISEVINREHLSKELSTGLRYLGLGMLYLSSTADMFITGLGNSVWFPMILAALSILGVFAGILFRVRSYLYLGVGFLVLVIFSMIWHAAVDLKQAWIWWVSGILLGAAILALFALFEKRRLHMAQVLEEFRQWR